VKPRCMSGLQTVRPAREPHPCQVPRHLVRHAARRAGAACAARVVPRASCHSRPARACCSRTSSRRP
jgi:hypothetical protein